MKIDILAFGAHPDDVELGCAGVLLSAVKYGKKTAVVDLTKGELGTRGSAETRSEEAARATNILQLSARENIGLSDGFFEVNEENIRKVIAIIRRFQPEIVLCNAPQDRHPDHGRASRLVKEAVFLSGLIKILTTDERDQPQNAWRPKQLFHYIQDKYLEPDFVVDISDVYDEKLKSILAYNTQFNAVDDGPQTYISKPEFLKTVEGRALIFGKRIGVQYGEGFIADKALGIKSFDDLIIE